MGKARREEWGILREKSIGGRWWIRSTQEKKEGIKATEDGGGRRGCPAPGDTVSLVGGGRPLRHVMGV